MLRNDVTFASLGDAVVVSVVCRDCGKEFIFPCSIDQVKAYKRGDHIQDVFPELSCDERELFISGLCEECWDKLFSCDDED